MTLYETKIYSLIYLLSHQSQAFTEADKTSLETLIDTLPNDTEEIANAIVLWYEDKPTIKNAFHVLATQGKETLGIPGKPTRLKPEEYKAEIKNAIRAQTSEKPSPNPPTP